MKSKWPVAVGAAILVVRSVFRFVGLDKIREPVIERAALLACTGEYPASKPLAKIALDSPELARELNALIDKAAQAAREALAKETAA